MESPLDLRSRFLITITITIIFFIIEPGRPGASSLEQPASKKHRFLIKTIKKTTDSQRPSGHPPIQPAIRHPTTQPASRPTSQPTSQPTIQPANQPTNQPASQPTNQPTNQPTSQPTNQPTSRVGIQELCAPFGIVALRACLCPQKPTPTLHCSV